MPRPRPARRWRRARPWLAPALLFAVGAIFAGAATRAPAVRSHTSALRTATPEPEGFTVRRVPDLLADGSPWLGKLDPRSGGDDPMPDETRRRLAAWASRCGDAWRADTCAPDETRALYAAAVQDGLWPPNARALATPDGLRAVATLAYVFDRADPANLTARLSTLAGQHLGTPSGDLVAAAAWSARRDQAADAETRAQVTATVLRSLEPAPGAVAAYLLSGADRLDDATLAAVTAAAERRQHEPLWRVVAREALRRGDLDRTRAIVARAAALRHPDPEVDRATREDWAAVSSWLSPPADDWRAALARDVQRCFAEADPPANLEARWRGRWQVTGTGPFGPEAVLCDFTQEAAPDTDRHLAIVVR